MSLIKCPECGKEVSDHANTCPSCAYPLASKRPDGTVRIKMPPSQGGWLGLAATCTISDALTGKLLWEGRCDQVAEIYLEKKTEVVIKCGIGSNPLETTIDPAGNSRYAITQDTGMHLWATYNISKVDVVDSE